jgi:sulfofructose kinase
MPRFDVVGVGLNATDTLLVLPRFPAYAGKEPYDQEILSPGGQVTGALAVCARLGLLTKYIGTVGDDERGRVQLESLRVVGINLDDVEVRPGEATQTAYILIDRSTGERTIVWRRCDGLRLEPEAITPERICCARLLHIDAHDTLAAARATEIARGAGMSVTADIDMPYAGLERVLANVDYLIASSEFPGEWTGERDPFRALEKIQEEYRMRLAAMTLGAHGALARTGDQFIYSPGFVVDCADTTGAGDVFHGAFCYAVIERYSIAEALDFSNVMAALNCTALGARGNIPTLDEARDLMSRAPRRPHPEFASR